MKKISKSEQMMELKTYPKEVIRYIGNTVDILDENYGIERNMEGDIGGYVIVAETITDVQEIRENILKGIVEEYTDIIECSEGVNWTSSLFLLSSDYAIVVVCTEELSKFLIK
ncbi:MULTISPECIES: hypothetical protein [Bacillota]|uniref:hypothetical protein n=1 Tax=Bacillota TaxID=1239 RepID=UPI00232FD043|nr:hypothetical protein [Turicibacter sanguinis]MDB8460060.1 hypothetical protein [Turicibacter sanguinis]